MLLKDKFIDPFTDFGFKKLFGTEPNKELLIDFLNQILPEKHHIQELAYLSVEKLGATIADRKAIFDLYCTSPTGERFIVEIQKSKQNFFQNRSLFYATFPIQDNTEDQLISNFENRPKALQARIFQKLFDAAGNHCAAYKRTYRRNPKNIDRQ
jgi:predicted transposase/invertase (TIGR01784 family)